MKIQEKGEPEGENSQCKGPERGPRWAHSKDRRIIVAGVLKEGEEGKVGRQCRRVCIVLIMWRESLGSLLCSCLINPASHLRLLFRYLCFISSQGDKQNPGPTSNPPHNENSAVIHSTHAFSISVKVLPSA